MVGQAGPSSRQGSHKLAEPHPPAGSHLLRFLSVQWQVDLVRWLARVWLACVCTAQ